MAGKAGRWDENPTALFFLSATNLSSSAALTRRRHRRWV
jgi:hypothetical protein